MTAPTSATWPQVDLLRCLRCGSRVKLGELARPGGYPELGPDGRIDCVGCPARYPLVAGTPRMVDGQLRAETPTIYPQARVAWNDLEGMWSRSDIPEQIVDSEHLTHRTATSFAYEWQRFGQLRPEWRKNFLDYLHPLSPEWLRGKRVLDVGTGSGRHARQAAELGADVVAVDVGEAIDVARRNLAPEVLTVQASAEDLPFEAGTFDLVMSVGVLHHLPDPAGALRAISRYARPGGFVHVYVYWHPPWRWHRAVLKLVSEVRRITVRLPHPLLHGFCYPLAAALLTGIVLPYRAMRGHNRLQGFAEALPLKAYADYPFAVLVNDQFDRLSAPIEHRYEAKEVEQMLVAAGLGQPRVVANHGWVGNARQPENNVERPAR